MASRNSAEQTSSQAQDPTLCQFRAGRMSWNGRNVQADPRKGTIALTRTEDGLLHFQWMLRPSGATIEDQIIFPGEAVFEKAKESPGRVYVLRFLQDDRLFFFWMQEPVASKDALLVATVNRELNNTDWMDQDEGVEGISAGLSAGPAEGGETVSRSANATSSSTPAPNEGDDAIEAGRRAGDAVVGSAEGDQMMSENPSSTARPDAMDTGTSATASTLPSSAPPPLPPAATLSTAIPSPSTPAITQSTLPPHSINTPPATSMPPLGTSASTYPLPLGTSAIPAGTSAIPGSTSAVPAGTSAIPQSALGALAALAASAPGGVAYLSPSSLQHKFVALEALQQALRGANAAVAAGSSHYALQEAQYLAAQEPSLVEVLKPESILPLVGLPGLRERVAQYLPEGLRSEAAMRDLLQSPQFHQQLEVFSQLLQSGQVDWSQFGIDASKYGVGVGAFLNAIEDLAKADVDDPTDTLTHSTAQEQDGATKAPLSNPNPSDGGSTSTAGDEPTRNEDPTKTMEEQE
eukprot:TRINITY_DN19490_c0_g1_i1.p1 TRINITY_DN19490_c0_g1~~TRINITY_DN19490_c0_g1_i1.p1  ORF type:complete len:529 (+),score=107.69 TRINITY_DN19490_c0_g1_i1:28-1587(+)